MIPAVANCGQRRPQRVVAFPTDPHPATAIVCCVLSGQTVNRGHWHEAFLERCRGRRGDSDRRAGFGASVHDIRSILQRGDRRFRWRRRPQSPAAARPQRPARKSQRNEGAAEAARPYSDRLLATMWPTSSIAWNCSGLQAGAPPPMPMPPRLGCRATTRTEYEQRYLYPAKLAWAGVDVEPLHGGTEHEQRHLYPARRAWAGVVVGRCLDGAERQRWRLHSGAYRTDGDAAAAANFPPGPLSNSGSAAGKRPELHTGGRKGA